MDKISYLYVFIQSNLIEIVIYYLFYRKLLGFSKSAMLTTFSNSITHPLVFFGFMAMGKTYLTSILLAESFAIIGETFLHWYFGKIGFARAATAALVANLVSWQLAPMLTYLIFF